MAILPQHAGAGAREFAEVLARALSQYGQAVVVDQAEAEGQAPHWFSELEGARASCCTWRTSALALARAVPAQADAIVYVAVAGNEPAVWSEACDPMRAPRRRPSHIALGT
jgi:hypothetical protein